MSHDACFSAVIHEGETVGKLEKINGVETYYTLPKGRYDETKAVVLCSDVFGIPLPNNRLLCDSFAQNGWAAYLPDITAGNPAPIPKEEWARVDKAAWFADHEAPKIIKILEAFFAGLEEQGVRELGAIGYCYGAREVVHFAINKRLKCVAVAHPSRVDWDSALDQLANAETPILINSCETDAAFPSERQQQADKVLGGKSFYKRTYAPGCSHGFAVRGDLSVPAVKKGKEEAFRSQLDWLQKYL